ncbi:hypothetical protein [Bradyrhizobium diazoefficiens]|uniref:hypothetical protein n=1 Tax=Bradyrhizobium diazoefficiens TaxID=1355477 RepID=UPI002715601E|nr:hypothetical protein [Bradyrhizobium diazoefficiens]WLA54406.1 hypothetical protein QIH81_28140 [Bradyrhizobium diazoefficiens]
MRNRIDIDHIHRIVREIGERLRASLKPEPEVPASLRAQIDRLREFEAAEHCNKVARLSRGRLGRTWMNDAAGEASCIVDLE